MNHAKKLRKFSRTRNQRNALLVSLAASLVRDEKIKTTLPKAKSLRPVVEKLVTIGKEKGLASSRILSERVGKLAAHKIVKTLSPKYMDRKGGYTRITKLPRRVSDRSEMAVIEFV